MKKYLHLTEKHFTNNHFNELMIFIGRASWTAMLFNLILLAHEKNKPITQASVSQALWKPGL